MRIPQNSLEIHSYNTLMFSVMQLKKSKPEEFDLAQHLASGKWN